MKVENLDLPERIKQDYLDSGIEVLNPPQEKAVKNGLMDEEDLIIASPTASGKTFIAELGIVNQVVKNEGKAVYIVPLKALASEKYEDFTERYEDLNVMMSVGDKDESGDYLETADIVIVTSEKLDSMLRHNPSWIHDINLVVTDEIHLLTSPNRGPTLEITLTRLRDILDFQMLGLSATISNSNELADWLDATLVESSYRPVELEEGIMHGNEVEFYPEDYEPEENKKEEKSATSFKTGSEIKNKDSKTKDSHTEFIEDRHGRPTLNLLQDTLNKEKQCIVFCNSRKGSEKSSDRCGEVTENDISRTEKEKLEEYAEIIENALGTPTSQCKRLAENVKNGSAFHHAGLTNIQRKTVEKGFKEGLIRSVSATPTLAAGINLPAYRVVMRDLKRYTGRGMEYIPVMEYEQMCLPYDQKILLPNGKREKIGNIVENKKEIGVLSYNTDKNQVENKKISDHFKNSESEILEIKTETGDFKLTKNHPVLVNQNGEDSWIQAKKLREGNKIRRSSESFQHKNPYFYTLFPEDCYAVNTGSVLTKYKKEFELTDKEVAENLGLSSSTIYHYRNNKKAIPLHGIIKACKELGMSKDEIAKQVRELKSSYGNTIHIPEKTTTEFMWLLGIIVTDGNLNKTQDKRTGRSDTSIRVFNTNKEIIEKAKSIFNSLGLECYEEEREGKYRLEVGNTLLAELMNEVFGIPYGNKSQRTEIPEIIFQLPKTLRASFIEGVFDGDGSYYENKDEYKRRIHFSTSSEKFATDLQELLASLGTKSRVSSKIIKDLEIRGKTYEINKESYSLKVRDKNSINRLAESINPVKADLAIEEYSNYHNSNNHRKKLSNYTEILNIESKGKEEVYNIEVEDNHNYLSSSRAVLHNCGRAGRPKYDDTGQAISIAKNPGAPEEILERFILGEPERIQSKLAAEPILRMHTLALVASKFCNSMEDLLGFYRKTFYAYQYGDMREVEDKVEKVVRQLKDYGFLERQGLEATKVGKRVSDLYIDPDSANLILESLKKAEEKEVKPISYLFMLSRTTEMQPRPRVRDKEAEEIENAMFDAQKYLLESIPEEWSTDYEHFLECMKNSLMMKAWISEVDEEQIMDKYNTAPGGIRAKMRNADWLLYGSRELAHMEGIDVEKDLEKLRLRLQHGISEELLQLVNYDQIGRVRARKLHDHGIRDRETIRETSFEKLKKLIGEKTARKLKKQVGQENIFDRENIMDYFDQD